MAIGALYSGFRRLPIDLALINADEIVADRLDLDQQFQVQRVLSGYLYRITI